MSIHQALVPVDLVLLVILHNFQGSHRLEKFFNLEGYLEKSLNIKYALKSTGKSYKVLEIFYFL